MSVREILAVGFLVAGMVGCASPQEHFYTLMPDSQHPVHGVAEPARAIVVGAVSVPEAVNRPQLVLELADHQRELLEQERWIEPVAEDLQRAIAQHLSADLPDTAVSIAGEHWAGPTAYQVLVQVRRFDLVRGSGAHLDAHWVITGKDAVPLREDNFSTDVAASGRGYEALVRAQSSAVAALAEQIARALPDAGIAH